jgi:hypothetical protein
MKTNYDDSGAFAFLFNYLENRVTLNYIKSSPIRINWRAHPDYTSKIYPSKTKNNLENK